MRVSVSPGDRGYRPDAHLYLVTLNGERQKSAITADDVRGFVTRYITDSQGIVQGDPTGKLKIEQVLGTVTIENTDQEAP